MILKIKKTIIWYYFLSFVIVPIYDFFWKNIINFKGRILYFQWFNKNRNYSDLEKNGGVLKIDDLDLFTKVSNEVLNACTQKIITETKNKINTITYDNYNQSNNAENKYFTEIFDNLDIETKKKIIDFASSEFMISTAAKYLGVYPILSKIVLTYNIPKNYENKRGAMMFHKDEYGYKSMDIFMAINDIDENTGPLKAIKTKFDNLGPFVRIIKEEKIIPGNRGKIKDENILENNNVINGMITTEGKSGTAILVDSFRCYHAGGHCKTKPRILLRILYSTIDAISLPKIEKFKKQILFQEYISENIKKDKFKNFFYLKRSSFFKNKKFSYFLYNFYRALSFKF